MQACISLKFNVNGYVTNRVIACSCNPKDQVLKTTGRPHSSSYGLLSHYFPVIDKNFDKFQIVNIAAALQCSAFLHVQKDTVQTWMCYSILIDCADEIVEIYLWAAQHLTGWWGSWYQQLSWLARMACLAGQNQRLHLGTHAHHIAAQTRRSRSR